MDLMLITDEEYKALDRDILTEQIHFEMHDDILSKLYNKDFDRILITKRYVETVGTSRVYNAINAVLNMSFNFSSKVFLLNHNADNIDKMISDFIKLGVRVINIEVMNMNHTEFIKINIADRVDISEYKEDTLYSDILEIVNELKDIRSTDLKEYINLNYSRVVTSILRCEQALAQHKELSDKVVELSKELTQIKTAFDFYKDKYRQSKLRLSELKHDNNTIKQLLCRYSSSIKAFNAAVLKTNINEEFVFQDRQRTTMVIYFKELEDIGFFKVYNVLYDTLKHTYNLNIKSLVLESNNRYYFNPYKGYTILKPTPKVNDVILNDMLVKHGNARKVLELITRPQNQLDFLLVYDRTFNPEICLDLPKEYVLFLGNKRENYINLDYKIPDSNFISPCEGDYQDMSFLYRDTDDLTDISFKIYCNTNTFFKSLIGLCLEENKHR